MSRQIAVQSCLGRDQDFIFFADRHEPVYKGPATGSAQAQAVLRVVVPADLFGDDMNGIDCGLALW